jgi:hypothetical protein
VVVFDVLADELLAELLVEELVVELLVLDELIGFTVAAGEVVAVILWAGEPPHAVSAVQAAITDIAKTDEYDFTQTAPVLC